MKPRMSPMGRFHYCLILRYTVLACLDNRREHALVVFRNDFDELVLRRLPVIEQLLGDGGAGITHVALEHLAYFVGVFRIHRFKLNHLAVAMAFEVAGGVQHERQTARHTGGKITSGLADYDYASAGHVFAAMVAHTFNDSLRARISHGKTLARDTAEIGF